MYIYVSGIHFISVYTIFNKYCYVKTQTQKKNHTVSQILHYEV